MVQAILAGRKMQTRRVLKYPPSSSNIAFAFKPNDWPKRPWVARRELTDNPGFYEITHSYKCPYGNVGDQLWVREAACKSYKGDKYFYKADYAADYKPEHGWKPSIHMPKEAARIWLQVTGITVEKLNDINEQDAIAEGVESWIEERLRSKPKRYRVYEPNDDPEAMYSSTAYYSFSTLWMSINGVDSWDANPWVWVVSFKVITTTGIDG